MPSTPNFDPPDAQAALSDLLSNPFAHFQKVGNDDWRDPGDDALSLSSKGWYNHKTGEHGDIFSFARKHGWKNDSRQHLTRHKPETSIDPPDNSKGAAKLWQKAETEAARQLAIQYLAEKRKIPPSNFSDLFDSGLLKCVQKDKEKYEFLCPMLTHAQVDHASVEQDFGDVLKVHRVILKLDGDSLGDWDKRQLGSPEDGLGRLSYLTPLDANAESLNYLVIEGLEDALSLRSSFPDHHVLVCQSKVNLRHVPEFLPKGSSVLIISDHDAHENPNENGEFAAAQLRQQLQDLGHSCRAEMPATPKDDANSALQRDALQEWRDSLVDVPQLPRSKDDFFLEPRSALKIRSLDWLIQGVVEKRTLAAIIGESGSGKSFLALDLAACVQTGKPWHGREVQQGEVVYLAGEGRSGLVRRIGAWEHRYKDSLEDLMISSRAIDLGDSRSQLLKVQQALRSLKRSPVLIVIDTLARHHTGDENSASEMSSFISNLDRLSEEFKATVLIVHHAGKDPSRGARGSSAFRAALDLEILVTNPATGITNLTCEKAKDAEPFPPMSLQLKQSDVVDELGRMLAEPDGSPVRSCILEECDYVPAKTRGLSETQVRARDLYLSLSKQSEAEIVTRASWYKALEQENIANQDSTKKRLLDKMVEVGVFNVRGEGRDTYFTTGFKTDFEAS